MDRRGFIQAAEAVSLAAALEELAASSERASKQSIAALQQTLACGAITSEGLTAARAQTRLCRAQ
jgi:hypothetical protein